MKEKLKNFFANILWTLVFMALAVLFFYLSMEKWMPFEINHDSWPQICFATLWILAEYALLMASIGFSYIGIMLIWKDIKSWLNQFNQDN